LWLSSIWRYGREYCCDKGRVAGHRVRISLSVKYFTKRELKFPGCPFVLLPCSQTLSFIHIVGEKRSPGATINCLEKHRSPVRTKYSLCYFTPSRGCRGFTEIAPGCPPEIARHSGKQCSIGQPVLFAPSSDAFQLSSVSPQCVYKALLFDPGRISTPSLLRRFDSAPRSRLRRLQR
jgi:hypothetical protein